MVVRSDPEVTETPRKKRKQKPVAMPPPPQKENTLPPKPPNDVSAPKIEQQVKPLEKVRKNGKNVPKETKEMELRLRKITTTIDQDRNKTDTVKHPIQNNKKQKNKSPKPKRSSEKVSPPVEVVAPMKKEASETKLNGNLEVPLPEPINNARNHAVDENLPQIDIFSLPPEVNEKIDKSDGNVSEDSAPPEWADEQVNGDNYDAEYSEMVQATAEVFSSRAETPASSSSQSSAPPQISFTRNAPRKPVGRSESELTTDETDASRIDHVGPGRSRKYKPPKERKSKVCLQQTQKRFFKHKNLESRNKANYRPYDKAVS